MLDYPRAVFVEQENSRSRKEFMPIFRETPTSRSAFVLVGPTGKPDRCGSFLPYDKDSGKVRRNSSTVCRANLCSRERIYHEQETSEEFRGEIERHHRDKWRGPFACSPAKFQ